MGAAVASRRPRVHGLDGGRLQADWPALVAAEFPAVAGMFPDIGAVRRVAWQSPRPFAASGIVSGMFGDVFVKRHHAAVRDGEDLAEEHRFIAHLRAGGAAVPRVLQTRDGATSVTVGDAVYEFHGLAEGEDSYRDAVSWSPFRCVAHARAAGRALAGLHRAADGFAAPTRKTGLIVGDFAAFGSADPWAAIARRVGAQPLLAAALAGRPWQEDFARILMPFHAALSPFLAALNPLWTHNDLHASNLMWRGDEVANVVDFGLANRTCANFDIATAIERNTVEWLRLEEHEDIAHADLAIALIEAYREAEGAAGTELRALPHMLPLIHVEFALSELAYFHGILRSPAKAELAYRGFLLGHAQWFTTPRGRTFLKAVGDTCA